MDTIQLLGQNQQLKPQNLGKKKEGATVKSAESSHTGVGGACDRSPAPVFSLRWLKDANNTEQGRLRKYWNIVVEREGERERLPKI